MAAVAQVASADPSLECSVNSGSQVETAECLAKVEAVADQALSVMLGFARNNAMELDAVTERDIAVPALEVSQTAWIAYRQAKCDYDGALFGGGSGTGIEIRSCRIDMTRDRIDALEATLR